MKNSTNKGVDQHYNVQVAVDQDYLMVAPALSNHPNDKQEAEPTLNAISPKLGKPKAAALDNGYFSAANIQALEDRKVDPYIATGRELPIKIGAPSLKNSLNRLRKTPARKLKWLINSRRRSVRPFTGCVSVRWNP